MVIQCFEALAEVVNDLRKTEEGSVAEMVLTQVFPDVLERIRLGAVRGQGDQADRWRSPQGGGPI